MMLNDFTPGGDCSVVTTENTSPLISSQDFPRKSNILLSISTFVVFFIVSNVQYTFHLLSQVLRLLPRDSISKTRHTITMIFMLSMATIDTHVKCEATDKRAVGKLT